MDAKANTLVCVSPLSQSDPDKRMAGSHSTFMLVVSGGIPGTMVPLSEEGTRLGRSADNSFQINDITVSREHAFVMVDNLGSVHIRDEGSTNGTYLNGKRIKPQRLVEVADGDRVQLGTTVVLKLVRLDPKDEQFQREMFERTVRDTLTGLYNRAYLLNQIGVLAERSASQGIGLAVLMLDIDYFKQINDQHGHLVGDGVLRQVAAILRESTRAEDLVARFGGEEFVVVLPVSVPDLATERAERIRSNLAERRLVAPGVEIRVTASIGLAFAGPESARNAMALITTADEALYQAKADGRNRVVFGHGGLQRAARQTESTEFASLLFSSCGCVGRVGTFGSVLEKPIRSGYDQSVSQRERGPGMI